MPDVSLGLAGSFAHGRVITELLAPDDSAAGEGFVYQLDGSYWERPVSLSFTLNAGTDDAQVVPAVEYLDGSGVVVARVGTNDGPDSDTGSQFTYLRSYTGALSGDNSSFTLHLPKMFLQPTWTLQVVVGGTFTEGNLSGIRYYRERFITGPGGYEVGVQQDVTDERMILLGKLADILS